MAKKKAARNTGGTMSHHDCKTRFAALAELWLIQESFKNELFLQAEEAALFARRIGLPRVAVELLNDLNSHDGLKADDLREWERWPQREVFMRAIEAEQERPDGLLDDATDAEE